MHISWYLLDKRAATIQAIRDYNRMEYIINHSDEEVETAKAKAVGLGAVKMDGMPHGHNVRAGEDRILDVLEGIDDIKERRRLAEEYMAWFKPAWEFLSEDERFVLAVFYQSSGRDAAGMICSRFGIEKSSAYNKKNRALRNLTVLLYGIC